MWYSIAVGILHLPKEWHHSPAKSAQAACHAFARRRAWPCGHCSPLSPYHIHWGTRRTVRRNPFWPQLWKRYNTRQEMEEEKHQSFNNRPLWRDTWQKVKYIRGSVYSATTTAPWTALVYICLAWAKSKSNNFLWIDKKVEGEGEMLTSEWALPFSQVPFWGPLYSAPGAWWDCSACGKGQTVSSSQKWQNIVNYWQLWQMTTLTTYCTRANGKQPIILLDSHWCLVISWSNFA